MNAEEMKKFREGLDDPDNWERKYQLAKKYNLTDLKEYLQTRKGNHVVNRKTIEKILKLVEIV